MMRSLKRNWLVVSKLTWGIWQILTWALKILKKINFNSFWAKYILFELKKSTEEFSFMTLKSNAKFGEELTRHSKLAWGIWWILTRALENLTNSHFSGLLLNKVYIAWAIKSTEELSFKTLKSDAKFGEKLTCYFKIDIKNLTNFDPRIQKSKSLLLTGSFSRNYIFFEPRKVQRNYLSWHGRVVQNAERNWLVVSNLTWGIWQFLTRALKSLQNFYFNGLFLRKVYVVWAK